MPENRAIITPEMLDINPQPAHVDAFTNFFGRRGLAFATQIDTYKHFQDDSKLFQRYTDGIDRYFYGQVMERYNLNSKEEATGFFLKQLKHANEAVGTVVSNSLPEGFEDVYGLINEVAIVSDSPAERVYDMLSSKHDEIEYFEFIRQFSLAEISAQLHHDTKAQRLHTKLSRLQSIFNQQLFSPDQTGSIRNIRTHYGYHDDVTNEFVTQASDPDSNIEGVHIIQHNYNTRYVDGIGYVLTQPRKKADKDSILKGLEKANKMQTSVNTQRDVHDSIGIMLTVLGDDEKEGTEEVRDLLTGRVVDVLNNNINCELPISKVEEDSVIDGRSKTKGMNWRRLKVYVQDINRPIEIVIFDEKAHTDNRFKVGTPGNKDESNRAHKLYEVDRAQSLFPLLFPNHIYNGHNYSRFDIPSLMNEKRESTVFALKNARRSFAGED